jgi:folate-binding protein YgfZ
MNCSPPTPISVPPAPAGVIARPSNRFGVPGSDWWVEKGANVQIPNHSSPLEGDELETMRIANGIPAWGKELKEGILPPEAGLDATDISYQKGCYIGQEVISRIKSAGKLNKRLMRLQFDASLPVDSLVLVDCQGASAGEITSIAPLAESTRRLALGYVKRGVSAAFVQTSDGVPWPIVLI